MSPELSNHVSLTPALGEGGGSAGGKSTPAPQLVNSYFHHGNMSNGGEGLRPASNMTLEGPHFALSAIGVPGQPFPHRLGCGGLPMADVHLHSQQRRFSKSYGFWNTLPGIIALYSIQLYFSLFLFLNLLPIVLWDDPEFSYNKTGKGWVGHHNSIGTL